MDIIHKEYVYSSTTGIGDIYAQSWIPANSSDVKAVFQIIHGMAEHGDRYKEFATFLCSNGYAVFVNDHVGHGKSVSSDSELGYFGERDGWIGFVNDAKLLTDIAKSEYPGRPIILFGHSMGSFVARYYAEKFWSDISGAIFSGTSGTNPAAGVGIAVASLSAKLYGSKHRSNFINKLAFGSYNKHVGKVRTEFDWLSRDEAEVDKYIKDDKCGFLFTSAGYRDMFKILKAVSSPAWYKSIPFSLPILLVSGEMDPVGEYGKGVRQVASDLKSSGHRDVSMKLYKNMRHEILNEIDRKDVFYDLLAWSDSVVNRGTEKQQ